MTVYARSDVMGVSISAEHGGCGQSHSRPVRDGAPDKVWALTCNDGCEDVLRNDPHWAGHPDDVPETPDEKMRRESATAAGRIDQQNATANALQELAKLGDLPKALQQLTAVMTGGKLADGTEGSTTQECPNGHTVPLGPKFCPECGSSMLVPEEDSGSPAPAKKAATPPAKKTASSAPPRRKADD